MAAFWYGQWSCNCCYQPCKSPACWGSLPTVAHTMGWATFHSMVHILDRALVLALTVVWFISCNEPSTAVTTMDQELFSSLSFTSEQLNRTGRSNILHLFSRANIIASLLKQLSDYYDIVGSSAMEFDPPLVTWNAQVYKLQPFVEDWKSSVPTCTA